MALSLRVLAPLWKLGRLGNVEDDPAAKTIRRLEGRLLDLEVNHRLLQQALELLSTVLQPDSNGLLLTPYIHNTAGNNTKSALLGSGTYAPTISATTNVASSVALQHSWLRVGNVVTVSGTCSITPTAGATLTQYNLTLPVTSNIAATNELSGGGGVVVGTAANAAMCVGDVANDACTIQFVSIGTGAQFPRVTFTYLVH